MIDLQMNLLHAAIDAGVPRFIPSDYCIDYTKLPDGSNRNLDLRRKFNEQLDKTPIEATSILNGMFTDLLTGEAPLILFGLKRVIYWGDANQNLDFTTLENTAEYTGRAAVDEATPRYLRIAGDVVNAEGLKDAVTAATGNGFKLLRVGGEYPDKFNPYLGLGDAYLANDEKGKAIKSYEDALLRSPGNTMIKDKIDQLKINDSRQFLMEFFARSKNS